jgi:Xaa-Pro aminopeptidase
VYPHQIERLTTVLEREGLAAVVATSAANVFYMTDFRGFGDGIVRPERFAVWTPRGVSFVVPAADVAHVISEGVEVDHLGAFGDAACSYAEKLTRDEERVREAIERREPSPGAALVAALRALGVNHGRIGLDESNFAPASWERLTAQLAGFTVVPGAAALLTARRVKSPYEIECLGRALWIAEEALNAVLQMLKPGVTEREAAEVYQSEVLKRDATPYPPSIAFGERTWMPFPPATDRALKTGDLVRFDVGALFKGYCSSVARTAVMGEPTEREASMLEAVQAGLEAGIDAVKPGVTAGAVYDAVVSRARGAGLPGFPLGHVGHAIGLEPYEDPRLEAGNATRLETGEVLRIDVPNFEVGWGGVALRDTVLVTTTDSRVLNRSVRGLIVLD